MVLSAGQSHELLFHACEVTDCGQGPKECDRRDTRKAASFGAILCFSGQKAAFLGRKWATIGGFVLPVDY
jgi:hypothetical protein